MVGISVLAGIIALVFAIIFYVKFFQMAADINRMSRIMEELAEKNKASLKKGTSAEQSQESASTLSAANTDATQTTESTSENNDVFSKIGWPIVVGLIILLFIIAIIDALSK